MIVLTCAFCAVLAVYETFEYLFCYDDEKREHKRLLLLFARAKKESERIMQEESGEQTRLLDAEEIPMETLPSGTNVRSDYEEISDSVYTDQAQAINTNSACDYYQRCDTEYNDQCSLKHPHSISDAIDGAAVISPSVPNALLESDSQVPRAILESLSPEEIDLNLKVLGHT